MSRILRGVMSADSRPILILTVDDHLLLRGIADTTPVMSLRMG
jgi:hypothetical protein